MRPATAHTPSAAVFVDVRMDARTGARPSADASTTIGATGQFPVDGTTVPVRGPSTSTCDVAMSRPAETQSRVTRKRPRARPPQALTEVLLSHSWEDGSPLEIPATRPGPDTTRHVTRCVAVDTSASCGPATNATRTRAVSLPSRRSASPVPVVAEGTSTVT